MRQKTNEHLQVISNNPIVNKISDAKSYKMTSPIKKVLLEINREKVKNRLKISDLFK